MVRSLPQGRLYDRNRILARTRRRAHRIHYPPLAHRGLSNSPNDGIKLNLIGRRIGPRPIFSSPTASRRPEKQPPCREFVIFGAGKAISAVICGFFSERVRRIQSHNLNKRIIYLYKLPNLKINFKYTLRYSRDIASPLNSSSFKFRVKLLTYNCQISATLGD